MNEGPAFEEDAPKTLWLTEKAEDKQLRTAEDDDDTDANDLVPADFVASDDDNADENNLRDDVTYALAGADKDSFSIVEEDTGAGTLTVATTHTVDYETQSTYSITIIATSTDAITNDPDERGTLKSRIDVTIKVVNMEDGGTVMLSQLEPQIGRSVTATVSDPDGGITSTRWQWYRGVNVGDDGAITTTAENFLGAPPCDLTLDLDELCRIDGATSATYTPIDDDEDETLTARVTYRDNIVTDTASPAGDDGDNAESLGGKPVQVGAANNTAPEYGDQDPNTEGDQTDATSRDVAENTKTGTSFGDDVSADPKDEDALLYTISGTDADAFGIDRVSGQLETKAELDYETRNAYTVVVTATDPSGASDSITVTINVIDGPDKAVISLTPPVPPIVAMEGSVTLSSDSPAVGEAITATLEDGNEVTGLTWQWANHAIGDEAYADIEGATDASYTPTDADFEKHVQGHRLLQRRLQRRKPDRNGRNRQPRQQRPRLRRRNSSPDRRRKRRSNGPRR